VNTAAEAVQFIDAAGFCLLFPVKNVPLPSLYYAMAHRAPLTWDKHSVKLWQWKDELPRKRRALYTKYFRGRGTFISCAMLPHFLAMRAAPARIADHEAFYAAGRISHDAHTLWKTIAEHGPLATLELRHACKMDGKAGNTRFKKAILELQCLLVVTHFGAEQETAAWASNRLELIARAFPKEAHQARRITPEAARRTLAKKYFEWRADAEPATLARLFGWSRAEAIAATGLRG
jgi:hypothetical protein